MERQIEQLLAHGRLGSGPELPENRQSFSQFLHGEDLSFAGCTAELVADYEQWLKRRGVTRNTVSFYMRITVRIQQGGRRRNRLAARPFRKSLYGRRQNPQEGRRHGHDRKPENWIARLPVSAYARICSSSVSTCAEWPSWTWPTSAIGPTSGIKPRSTSAAKRASPYASGWSPASPKLSAATPVNENSLRFPDHRRHRRERGLCAVSECTELLQQATEKLSNCCRRTPSFRPTFRATPGRRRPATATFRCR